MADESWRQRILHLFADILEYPQAGLPQAVQECEALVTSEHPEAGALLTAFRVFADKMPLGRIEEVYTGTFDLNAICYPYVGYHLFGENYKRSVFLVELKERYKAEGFSFGNELADHLSVLLRFLASFNNENDRAEIIQEALLPALKQMLKESEGADSLIEDNEQYKLQRHERDDFKDHPYLAVLQALKSVLQEEKQLARSSHHV